MNVGKLRHRVTLERCTETKNAAHEPVRTYTSLGEVWASIEPLTGREHFQAQASQSEISTRIRIRFFAGLKASDRVKYGTRVFDIVSPPIDREERHREMELLCTERIS